MPYTITIISSNNTVIKDNNMLLFQLQCLFQPHPDKRFIVSLIDFHSSLEEEGNIPEDGDDDGLVDVGDTLGPRHRDMVPFLGEVAVFRTLR